MHCYTETITRRRKEKSAKEKMGKNTSTDPMDLLKGGILQVYYITHNNLYYTVVICTNIYIYETLNYRIV